MLPRLLLISVMASSLAGCFWDDYETSRTITAEVPPDNENETLPDTGFIGNGNLEEETASGWSWDASAGTATFGLSTDQYYSGEQSFRTLIEAVGESWGDITAGPSGIEVEEGIYYFSGWILGTNGAMANFVASPSDSPETVLASQEVAVTSSWQKVELEITVPPGVTSLDLPVQMSYGTNLGVVIFLDSFALKGGGGGSEFIEIPITSDLQGWSTDQQSNTISFDEDLGVVINPDPAIDTQLAMYTFDEPLDPAAIDFTFVIDVPQAYLDAEGVYLQFYVQEVGGSYAGDYWNPESDGDALEEGINVITHRFSGENLPALIQRIGLQIKGNVDGLETITGVAISRIYYPGEGAEEESDLPLDSGWTTVVDETEGDPQYNDNGVSYSPVANDDSATYLVPGPDDLEGATFVFTITLDQDFVDSGAALQPFAQQYFDPYEGEWGCYINNADLTVGSAQYSCVLDGEGAPFNIAEGQSLRVGVQAKSTEAGDPAGTVTITDVQIQYPSLGVASGWRTNKQGETVDPPVYADDGVQYSPTFNEEQLVTDVAGPANLEGATYVFSVVVNQAFIDSGASVQPFAQAKVGSWPGEWGCYIDNSNLSTEGVISSCTLQAADFNLAEGEEMQIGVQAVGEPAGWVKITRVRVIYSD